MEKYSDLSLVGCGYVEDLEWTETGGKILIRVMSFLPSTGAQGPDEITLDCVISRSLEQRIRQLDLLYPFANGVRIEFFKVVFNRVGACHSGQKSGDPAHLLMLQGELQGFTSWKHDGLALPR